MGKVQGNKNQTLAFLSHGGVISSPWGNSINTKVILKYIKHE